MQLTLVASGILMPCVHNWLHIYDCWLYGHMWNRSFKDAFIRVLQFWRDMLRCFGFMFCEVLGEHMIDWMYERKYNSWFKCLGFGKHCWALYGSYSPQRCRFWLINTSRFGAWLTHGWAWYLVTILKCNKFSNNKDYKFIRWSEHFVLT